MIVTSRFTTLALAAALACASLASGASPVRADAGPAVTVDPAHTSATFSVSHLTITHVSGSIPLREATLTVDANGLPSSVKVAFDLAKLTTQNDRRDEDLRSDHWFDVAKNPDMTFVSTKIDPGASGAFSMTGDLTMHGVTKPVTLSGKFEGKVTDGGGRSHYGYSATVTVDRTQWNVGSYPPALVGTNVAVTIQVEAIAK